MKSKSRKKERRQRNFRITSFGNRILKMFWRQKGIYPSEIIGYYDFDDIRKEVLKLEQNKLIKISFQSEEGIQGALTPKGKWFTFLEGIKEFINLYFAFAITVLLTLFFGASFPAFLELQRARENQNEIDISFYSTTISFYFTIVIIIISILGIVSSKKETPEEFYQKIAKELKQICKKQDEIINAQAINEKSVLQTLTSIETVLREISNKTSKKIEQSQAKLKTDSNNKLPQNKRSSRKGN